LNGKSEVAQAVDEAADLLGLGPFIEVTGAKWDREFESGLLQR
jgi:hypothetical protein